MSGLPATAMLPSYHTSWYCREGKYYTSMCHTNGPRGYNRMWWDWRWRRLVRRRGWHIGWRSGNKTRGKGHIFQRHWFITRECWHIPWGMNLYRPRNNRIHNTRKVASTIWATIRVWEIADIDHRMWRSDWTPRSIGTYLKNATLDFMLMTNNYYKLKHKNLTIPRIIFPKFGDLKTIPLFPQAQHLPLHEILRCPCLHPTSPRTDKIK